MPTIKFKGKNSIWNHHLSVPYQILEKDKNQSLKGKNENENLIIEADNLIALKSLLPKYQGKIKCIYIDPPYNTGSERWTYNDKTNSPLIKEWLGKEVNRDDLTKHDKWLCMMTPRLKLLRELLNDEGVIFISIDDNELHHLLMLMDEIFGEDKHLGTIVWHRKTQPSYLSKDLIKVTEYLVVYKKTDKNIKFKGGYTQEGKLTELLNISNSYSKRVIKNDSVIVAGDYSGILKAGFYGNNELKVKLIHDTEVVDGTPLDDLVVEGRFKWTQNKINTEIDLGGQIFIKTIKTLRPTILKQDSGSKIKPPISLLSKYINQMPTNTDANAEMKSIFGSVIFDYPKPSKLIKYILDSATYDDKEALILDSFAGSGTLGQAVLDLNKEDGGNRKFILIQLLEKTKKGSFAHKAGFRYVHETTKERVKRVIKKEKLNVGFSYLKLGSAIDADSILSGTLPTYKEFAKYVYYLTTGDTMDNEKSIDEKSSFVGKNKGESIYLIYKKDRDELKNMAITLDWAETISKKDKGKKIVYAPACFLDEEYLEKFNIQFVSVPYSLFEKK